VEWNATVSLSISVVRPSSDRVAPRNSGSGRWRAVGRPPKSRAPACRFRNSPRRPHGEIGLEHIGNHVEDLPRSVSGGLSPSHSRCVGRVERQLDVLLRRTRHLAEGLAVDRDTSSMYSPFTGGTHFPPMKFLITRLERYETPFEPGAMNTFTLSAAVYLCRVVTIKFVMANSCLWCGFCTLFGVLRCEIIVTSRKSLSFLNDRVSRATTYGRV